MDSENSVGWLERVLIEAKRERWCTRPFCTTCGSMQFRRAFWSAAAQQAGIDIQAESARYPRDILSKVSDAEREQIVKTLIAGLRELPPEWSRSEAFRTIILDLDPPFLQHGFLISLDHELSETPAGEGIARMRAHAEQVAERQRQRQAYESRQAVEERKRLKREKKVAAHAERRLATLQRNSRRLELLATLARLSPADRLIHFATDPELNFDCISADLIPTQEQDLAILDKDTSLALINRIGRRKGAWGRLRRLLERHLEDEANSPGM